MNFNSVSRCCGSLSLLTILYWSVVLNMDARWQVSKNRQDFFSIFFWADKHFLRELSRKISYSPQTFFRDDVYTFILLPVAKIFLPFRIVSIQVRLMFCLVVIITTQSHDEDKHPERTQNKTNYKECHGMMSGTKVRSIFWVGSYGWLFQLIFLVVVQPSNSQPIKIQNMIDQNNANASVIFFIERVRTSRPYDREMLFVMMAHPSSTLCVTLEVVWVFPVREPCWCKRCRDRVCQHIAIE